MASKSPVFETPPYERQLDASWDAALSEGSRFFEERSAVQDALRRITGRLEQLGIPYAISGGMALFRHGFRRFTEDLHILVTLEGLAAIPDNLEGLGYLPRFTGSKYLRDTQTGVRIEFLVTGDYPGDGKPRPVAFPDPTEVAVDLGGIRFLSLPTLVELILASGMTGGLHRMKALTDVVALIETLRMPRDFADQLNPFVRDKFLELWDGVQQAPREP